MVLGGGPVPGNDFAWGGVRLLGSAGGQRLPVGPIPLFNRILQKEGGMGGINMFQAAVQKLSLRL